MFISAMLDLGVPFCVVDNAITALPIHGFHLERGTRVRSGIVAGSFEVHVDDKQPQRSWREIDEIFANATCPEPVISLARSIFTRLAEAEGSVHGVSPKDVHFHEVGAVDSIVDIVGAAAICRYLQPSKVICSPLPIGHGFVHAQHGILPLPAPATVSCLRGVPTYGVDVEGELVTPTGAAIVSVLANEFVRWPSMEVKRVGYGSGTKEFASRPNLLRVVMGKQSNEDLRESPMMHTVLEANVDDMTGELMGHAIGELLRKGALDVWVTPTTTKRGRPGMVLSVLAEKCIARGLRQEIVRQTTTIGVRSYDVGKYELARREVRVGTRFGEASVKVVDIDGVARGKPEYVQCAEAAQRHGVTVQDVMIEVMRNWRDGV